MLKIMTNKIVLKTALWVFIGLLSLGQLQKTSLMGSLLGGKIYLHDIFIMIWLGGVIFTRFTDFTAFIKEKIIDLSKVEKWFLLLILITQATNWLINFEITSLLYVFRLIVYLLFAVSLWFFLKSKLLDRAYTRFQFFSVGFFVLVLGFLQLLLIPDTRFLAILGWDDHYGRLISTPLDPGATGMILLMAIGLGLSLKYFKNSYLKFSMLLAFIIGIILTFSRATYLSLIVFSLIVIFNNSFRLVASKKIKVTLAALLFTCFIIVILLAPKNIGEGVNLKRTSTIFFRTSAVQQQVESVDLRTFLIGRGFYSSENNLMNSDNTTANTPQIESLVIPNHAQVPDNLFINLLLSSGIFGLGLFVLLLYRWGSVLVKKDIFMFAIFVSLVVHSQFGNSFFHPLILLVFLGGLVTIKKISGFLPVKNRVTN
jgi:hypothetical protein